MCYIFLNTSAISFFCLVESRIGMFCSKNGENQKLASSGKKMNVMLCTCQSSFLACIKAAGVRFYFRSVFFPIEIALGLCLLRFVL